MSGRIFPRLTWRGALGAFPAPWNVRVFLVGFGRFGIAVMRRDPPEPADDRQGSFWQ